MSEHFVEKYYGDLDNSTNKVQSRLEKVLDKNNSIKNYYKKLKKNVNKTCGFKAIN